MKRKYVVLQLQHDASVRECNRARLLELKANGWKKTERSAYMCFNAVQKPRSCIHNHPSSFLRMYPKLHIGFLYVPHFDVVAVQNCGLFWAYTCFQCERFVLQLRIARIDTVQMCPRLWSLEPESCATSHRGHWSALTSIS